MQLMNTSAKLYAVEPHSERLLRWLQSAAFTLADLYWAIFQAWGFLFLGLFAVALVVAGISEFGHPAHRWYLALPSISLGISFFVSVRVRRFAWAAFGLGIVWFVPVTVALALFLGPAHCIESPVLSSAVLALYVFPPLVGAALVTHAKHRGVLPRAGGEPSQATGTP